MKRHNIVSSIIDKLKTVTVENGYYSDFSNCVYSWKPGQIAQGTDLWVEVQDASSELGDRINLPNLEIKLSLNIVVFCASGTDTPELIRKAMDDIYRVLINNREYLITTYGSVKMNFTGDDMEVFEEDIIAGVGIVGMMLGYYELYSPAVPLPPPVVPEGD
ncbi:MAG: hypothetical protein LCH52_05455 [Bacteroidetes bacterium]|nr:hypothetical protein [Bacteroidota bacterium]